MQAPERFETSRLVLRKPGPADAEAIFVRYASDEQVTTYLAWPRHESIEQTRAFLEFSEAEWKRWPAGPYLIESHTGHGLLGSTGLAFDSPSIAATGYVLARDAWGRGYATEALRAMMGVARGVGVLQLYAHCHPDHSLSARVLEKCGFQLESRREESIVFPNLNSGSKAGCQRWRWDAPMPEGSGG